MVDFRFNSKQIMQNTYIKMWFIWNPIFVLWTYRERGSGEGVRLK